MFYILYGQDDFSLYQALEKIKANLGDPEMLVVNAIRLDGDRLTLEELNNNCNAAPFLSAQRLVIVKDLLGRFEPRQSKLKSSKAVGKSRNELGAWENLASYIKQMPETTVLILIEGKISGNNPLLKRLSPLAKVKTFPLLRGRSLRAWIQQRVLSEGGGITPQAVNLLAELIGGNLWTMNNEIQKLLLYTQGRSISEAEVRQLVSYAHEASVFSLIDAILEGQVKIAQRLLHQLYQEGASPNYILTMITRQVRLIALAKELSGLSRQQLHDRLGLASTFSLDKTLNQARLYNLEQVREAYNKLLEADLAIKTGKYSDQLALELLVTELSSCQT
jgi:DNA polymerase-3 subunit delta